MRSAIRSLGPSVLAVASACGPEAPHFEAIDEDCRQQCHVAVVVCPHDTPDIMGDENRCTDLCLDQKDQSAEEGRDCARSYEAMMTCVGGIELCEDLQAFAVRAPEGICAAEAKTFDQTCKFHDGI